jgi:hypothetical protein
VSLLPSDDLLRFVESQRVKVFPLAFRTNYQPCIKNNLKLASSSLVQIRAWAREFENCNWGLATGPQSGRLGLDIDRSGNGHKRDGSGWVNSMIEAHGRAWLDDAVRVRTGSGGLHLHFAWPAGIAKVISRVSPFADGVDVKASGGFLCVPPSVVLLADESEAKYTWESGNELTTPTALPDWLLELLLAPAKPTSNRLPTMHGQNGKGDGKVLDGVRHVTLFRFAAGLRGQGKTESEMLPLCKTENESRYLPPLSAADVEKAVASAAKYPAGRRVTVGSKTAKNSAPAQPPGPPPTQPASLIKTFDEYQAATPEKIDWVVTGLVARGALTHVDAKPKHGKTTLLLALTEAVLAGEPFMGLATTCTGVLYATEQNYSSFRPALERASLKSGSDLHILSLQDTLHLSWESVLTLIADHCAKRTNIGVLIVDTLGAWANLPAAGENDSATMMQVMRPLLALLSRRLAIINSLHSRKSLGEVGDSARGSSALSGCADILLSLRRLPGNQSKTLRQLEVASRFDESPGGLAVDLENGVYVARGTSSAVAWEDANRWLEENLPATANNALTMEQLLAAGADVEITRSTLQRALDGPGVARVGGGRRNDPFRFYRTGSRKVTLGGKFIV